MSMNKTYRLQFRCKGPMATDIGEIADRTGLQDIDETDDELLFGAVSGPRTEDCTN